MFRKIIIPLGAALCAAASFAADIDWPVYLGDSASAHYSKANQITPRNVARLQVAWTYNSGDRRKDNRSQIQCNPIIVEGVLYGTTPALKLVALDAATGKELWRFDPFAGGGASAGVNRGVVYWARGDDQRILFTANHYLYAVDARTGKLIDSFGKNGRVDIREGLGRPAESLFVISNTPGIIFENLLILGDRLNEGPGPSAPGHIRAFDVRTGKIEWIFHTIPYPGEPGYETWPPDAWKYIGGANVWTGFAVDKERGLVFCPTGSAAFDFWGGNRHGENLYANCLIALDAKTGKKRWHYQFIHHDLWDRDLPAPPNLITVRSEGKSIAAVAQVTKTGHVFVFNRETGQPVFPIQERIVPPSDLQGESAWPTQPIPQKPAPFARQLFSADQLNDITPEIHRGFLERFVKLRSHTTFLPPSKEGSIILPGFDGGAEWGGAAVDPARGILYVNANEMPWVLTMVETKPKSGAPASSGQALYNQICATCHGVNRQGDAGRVFPSLVNVNAKLKKSDILTLLHSGRGMMPGFAFLSNEQKEAVAGFVLGEEQPATTGREVQGDVLGGEPYSHTGYNRWLDTNGYPAIKPPWGTLNAINLNTGDYEWTVPLGEYPELVARGIPATGTENYGGPVVTSTGLIFIAASRDEMIRAFDQKTGRILWKAKLPAAGYATPSTYTIKGRQYLVIACGGGKSGTKSGDAYVAFALPK